MRVRSDTTRVVALRRDLTRCRLRSAEWRRLTIRVATIPTFGWTSRFGTILSCVPPECLPVSQLSHIFTVTLKCCVKSVRNAVGIYMYVRWNRTKTQIVPKAVKSSRIFLVRGTAWPPVGREISPQSSTFQSLWRSGFPVFRRQPYKFRLFKGRIQDINNWTGTSLLMSGNLCPGTQLYTTLSRRSYYCRRLRIFA